jgi:hypothetical protein
VERGGGVTILRGAAIEKYGGQVAGACRTHRPAASREHILRLVT